MGRILLVVRLAVRDLKRRRVETALLLLAMMAATTTLTLGLVLRDAAADPYQSTRQVTNGPDVVAGVGRSAELPRLEALAADAEVVDHSGPFPVTAAKVTAAGRTSDVQVIGRDTATATVDQPSLVRGSWARADGAVLEAAFAGALGVRIGDAISLNGKVFTVVGIAVDAAMPPYPGSSCLVPVGCAGGGSMDEVPADVLHNPGLVWTTEEGVRGLSADPAYTMNLRLTDPDAAREFVQARQFDGPWMESWQEILADATELAADAQILLMIGAWLLGLLAVASVSVMVGGRMADQTRRVGLLKAVGGTPGLVAVVLLAEYAVVAVAAAILGLCAGSLAAPLLTESSAGLIGSAGTPPLTLSTVAVVTAVALGVAVVATAVPALRAARSSTVGALADAARPPRRIGWLIGVSARLPVPLLLALRVAARRPRRVLLGMVSIAITVSGLFVALILNAFLAAHPDVGGYDDAQVRLLRQVIVVVMAVLFCLAAVNAVFITWATVLDNRHSSALARALGATPREVTAAMAAAQVMPALAGAVVGIFPGGFVLFAAINAITGGDSDRATFPSLWQLAALVLATVVAVAALTAVPASLGARRPVSETL